MAENNEQDAPLFRQEVFDAKNKQHIASIILTPSIPFSVISIVAGLIGLIILGVLYQGSYTRRMTVNGQLLPVSGLIRVQSPQTGLVLEKHVREGQHVNKGDVLYVLSSDRIGLSSRELQSDISEQIARRKTSLQEEMARNKDAESKELSSLSQRLMFLQNEAQTIKTQMAQQKQKVDLSTLTYQRYKELAAKDFIANEQLIQKEIDLTDQKSRLEGMQREVLNNQRDQTAAMRDMNDARARYANQNAQLSRTISTNSQESTEVEAKRRVVIIAPQSGTATLVSAEVGQAVDGATPLASLVPDNTVFEARLYAPSSAIGFVEKGSRVFLRYQAYPYQKFGLYAAEVTSVSSASISNQEAATFAPGVSATEPLYTITVMPKQQFVNVYGAQRALQSGLRVEADILQEKRRLYEWMLEPLFSIKGKMVN